MRNGLMRDGIMDELSEGSGKAERVHSDWLVVGG